VSATSPAHHAFPLPNELLHDVLEYLVDDNLESPHDVLSLLLPYRICNKAEFRKYIYRIVCFKPSREDIAALQQVANDPDRAHFVKVSVFKDVAPKKLDEDILTGAGLSKIECGFHKQWDDEQRNNSRILF
jgi:hypothetical protein